MNIQEIVSLTQEIQSTRQLSTLNLLYSRYKDYDSPHIAYVLGVRFLILGNNNLAKDCFIRGAKYGLKYPTPYYETPFIDSIGQCYAYLVTQFSTNQLIASKATALAYLYLSKAIYLTRGRAFDSYRTRAILFKDNESPIAIQNLIADNYNLMAMVEPFTLSDFYNAANVPGSPHSECLTDAKRIHRNLEDMSVGGKDANLYSLEELARLGESRHLRMFETLESKLKNGSLNMTFSELNLLNG